MKNEKDYSTGITGISAFGVILMVLILAMANKCSAQTIPPDSISIDSSRVYTDITIVLDPIQSSLHDLVWDMQANYQSVLIGDSSLSVDGQRLVTLNDLLKYADECYRDSTRTHTHDSKWYDKCYAQGGTLAQGYYPVLICEDSTHYAYTHKHPTFAGFIEWMNRTK